MMIITNKQTTMNKLTLWLLLTITIPSLIISSTDDKSTCADSTSKPLAQIQIAENPRIYIIDNAFSTTQLQALEELATKHLLTTNTTSSIPSSLLSKMDGTIINLYPQSVNSKNDIIMQFRKRMAMLTLSPESYGETLQVIQYTNKQKMEVHFDSNMIRGRFATVLVFLKTGNSNGEENNNNTGGELIFPWAKPFIKTKNILLPHGIIFPTHKNTRPITELTNSNQEPPTTSMLCSDVEKSNVLAIKPIKGRTVIWFNHNLQLKRLGYEALHAECPLKSSSTTHNNSKLIAQMYLRWYKGEEKENVLNKAINTMGLNWENQNFIS
jgi:hypothetical protein